MSTHIALRFRQRGQEETSVTILGMTCTKNTHFFVACTYRRLAFCQSWIEIDCEQYCSLLLARTFLVLESSFSTDNLRMEESRFTEENECQ